MVINCDHLLPHSPLKFSLRDIQDLIMRTLTFLLPSARFVGAWINVLSRTYFWGLWSWNQPEMTEVNPPAFKRCTSGLSTLERDPLSSDGVCDTSNFLLATIYMMQPQVAQSPQDVVWLSLGVSPPTSSGLLQSQPIPYIGEKNQLFAVSLSPNKGMEIGWGISWRSFFHRAGATMGKVH